MSEDRRIKKTDLVLSNGQYAFTQDTTTGVVKVLSGPTVVNVTGQEYPVVYDAEASRFVEVELEGAARKSPMAPQGFYIELHNPPATPSGAQPAEGTKEVSPPLLMGRRVNIPGPATFSLWPRQVAKVIEGHHLRSNQYLLGRVYDEEAAKANWQKAVLKVASGASADEPQGAGPQGTISELREEDLSVGQLFVIKGTEVSFYIPPTGVEVVPDDSGLFVREALTLERLQYCILVDENGDKDYQRGPRVVFPKPTQRFYEDPATKSVVFRPTELNEKQGIHVKVIAGYEEDGRVYREGEELFITGADTPIYIPRPEHSLVRYDGNAKHFATAVPAGEARYVMNRGTGVIRTVHGPTMLLPDPRSEVIVRRVLDDRECTLMYPGNREVLEYNRELRRLSERSPSTRAAVTEGEVRRKGIARGPQSKGYADVSTVHSEAAGPVADEWSRAATYSEPRTLTLSTKLAGAPAIDVWPGYAVMVVSKSGERRVEIGPKAILLEYDETLAAIEVSGDAPKGAGGRAEIAFLKLADNEIRDSVEALTRDHVKVVLDLSLRVRFVGDDPARWFAAGDYVRLVLDRVRHTVHEAVRSLSIDALHAAPSSLLEQAVLGGESELAFSSHGVVASGLELHGVRIEEPAVRTMFEKARTDAIASAVALERARAELAIEREKLGLARERLRELAESDRHETELAREKIARDAGLTDAKIDASLAELAKKLTEQQATDAIAHSRQEAALARQARASEIAISHQRAEVELELSKLEAATQAAVARFTAAQGPLAEAITMLGNQQVLAKVAEAVSAQRLFGGKDVAQVVGNLFTGTRLAGVFARIERGAVPDGEE